MQLAEKRRKIKVLEHHSERYKQLTAECRRKAREDKEKYLKDGMQKRVEGPKILHKKLRI